jgi:nucleoside-diphosphate-sugar epimerase
MDKINLCDKRILVTGGNGHLGRNLIEKLVAKKAIVFCLDIQPSIIYHLAASLDRTRDFEYAEKIFKINLNGTINLLNALKKIEYENFIFTSTSEVYGGKSIKPPFKEDDKFVPASPYSLSKYCAETTIKTFSEMYWKNYTILRLFNFFGDGMPNNFFIPQLIDKLRRDEDFNMTKGGQIRDFLHIDDVLQATLLATESNAYQEIFNVCSGEGVSIKELALKIKGKLKSVSKINFGAIPYRKNEVWEMIGSNDKITKMLGFKVKNDLIESISNDS